ncbi:YjcZ family sporulation protein [Turicibacter sp. TJ11]|nr:YjcZ family sporulation protein [Turicibacter sp. TJ11]
MRCGENSWGSGFAFILVLFILLVIIGCCCCN